MVETVPPIRLLYVEDSVFDVDLLRTHFTQEAPDFQITVVSSGAACLRQAVTLEHDMVLLDKRLPDMDGLDVLAKLRGLNVRLPVVLITSVGDDETVARALRAGAVDYVSKSGDYLSTLPVLLRTLLTHYQRQQRQAQADLKSQNILYVEPNDMDAELTQSHFATHAPQLKIQVLKSCVDALNLLSTSHDIDLVLTDLRVPGMDALEFVHEAKRRHLRPPIIVITGKGDEATAVSLLRLGASDYLVKRDNYLVQLPHAIEHVLHRDALEKTSSRLYTELAALNATLEDQVVMRTAQLRQTQAQLKATFDAIPDLIWQKDLQGRHQACNPVLERLLGRPQAQILGQVDEALFEPALAAALRDLDAQVIRTRQPAASEQWLTFANTAQRALFELVTTPMTNATGELSGILNVARDITERKASQEKIHRLSQLYAALSQCNQAIVRCKTQQSLFDQICHDAVAFGGLKMAWIGLVNTEHQRVDVVASAGEGASVYLKDLAISLIPGHTHSTGPVGQAVLTNAPVWCQDFMATPGTQPWRDGASLHGWAACAALPLLEGTQITGVFALYTGEVNAFDEATQRLLVEMAGDISFALANFERDAARARAEDALRLTRISVEAASEALFWITPEGLIVDVNQAACRSLGYERADLLTRHMSELETSRSQAQWKAHFDALRTAGSLTYETVFTTQGGGHFPVEVVANYVRFNDIERNCAFVRDITVHKASEARIQQLAHFDALTGLPNRTLLSDRISHALSMAQRTQSPLAVLLLDLDHFKYINDNLGHGVGDELLIELSQRLRVAVREEDTVARLGGDEFLIVLPGSDADAAAHVSAKMIALISQPCNLGPHELVITPSIGIAMYPEDGDSYEQLSTSADVAMYRAKQEGRNDFRFFTPEMQADSARCLTLENALRQAVRRQQLQLHYQPQLALQGGHIIGVEALLRWTHPELGVVSPAEFIPVAESSGQIIAIGEWVLREALGQLRRWIDAGLPPMTMAVNLSAVQFRHPNLPELVSQLLQETGVPPHLLELELTESVAMTNALAAIAIMDDLSARGVSLSIDDFGTGYSSLSHLKRFKISKLKIDQSFVRDIAIDEDDRAIVLTVINLARSLGIQTIAEGVETPEQLDFLHANGCDQIQGYHLSRPLPGPDALAFIRQHGGI